MNPSEARELERVRRFGLHGAEARGRKNCVLVCLFRTSFGLQEAINLGYIFSSFEAFRWHQYCAAKASLQLLAAGPGVGNSQ